MDPINTPTQILSHTSVNRFKVVGNEKFIVNDIYCQLYLLLTFLTFVWTKIFFLAGGASVTNVRHAANRKIGHYVCGL
jgi:hypothetical protein